MDIAGRNPNGLFKPWAGKQEKELNQKLSSMHIWVQVFIPLDPAVAFEFNKTQPLDEWNAWQAGMFAICTSTCQHICATSYILHDVFVLTLCLL